MAATTSTVTTPILALRRQGKAAGRPAPDDARMDSTQAGSATAPHPTHPNRPTRLTHRRIDPKASALLATPGLGLRRRQAARLAAVLDEVHVGAGQALRAEGRPGREAFVVVQGTATVAVGREVLLEIGPGDVVGDGRVLGTAAASPAITASTPVVVLVAGPADLAAFAATGPVRRAARRLAARIRAAADVAHGPAAPCGPHEQAAAAA
jgi:hypothetical protein